MEADKSLVSGSMALLVLKLLEDGDKYGYQMTSELRQRSEDVFHLKAGTLYPLLHSLEEKGLVTAYEREAAAGKPRRYYHLTKAGEGDGVAHLCRCRGPCAGGRCLLCRDLRASGAIWTRWRHKSAGSGPGLWRPGSWKLIWRTSRRNFWPKAIRRKRRSAWQWRIWGTRWPWARTWTASTGPGPSGGCWA